MRPINEIIIHCTATRPEWGERMTPQQQVAEVRAWHKARGWSDVGYHYLITRDGTVVVGRQLDKVGAHVKGHNTNTIGISLFGGFDAAATDSFSDHFTPAQDAALRRLISQLRSTYPEIKKISGHNEYANKGCPGFRVSEWLGGAAPRKNVAQSTTVQASAVQIASGAGAGISALGMLDGTAQIVALAVAGIVIVAALWIMRERIKHWSQGVR